MEPTPDQNGVRLYIGSSSSNSRSSRSSNSSSSSSPWSSGGDIFDFTSPGRFSRCGLSRVMDDTSDVISELSNSSVRCPEKAPSSRSPTGKASGVGKPGSTLVLRLASAVSGASPGGGSAESAGTLNSKVTYSGGVDASKSSNANMSDEVKTSSGVSPVAVGIASRDGGVRGTSSSANVSGASSSVVPAGSDSVISVSTSVPNSNSKKWGRLISSRCGSSRVVRAGSTTSGISLPDASSASIANAGSSTESSILFATELVASSTPSEDARLSASM